MNDGEQLLLILLEKLHESGLFRNNFTFNIYILLFPFINNNNNSINVGDGVSVVLLVGGCGWSIKMNNHFSMF